MKRVDDTEPILDLKREGYRMALDQVHGRLMDRLVVAGIVLVFVACATTIYFSFR